MSGEETFGVLFLTYIHLSTKSGSQAYSHRNDTLSVAKLIKYWKIFEFLLIFTQWISSSNQHCINNNKKLTMRQTLNIIKQFVNFLKSNFERESNQKWNLSKIHELFHIPVLIATFGAPINFDSSACERMHKQIAKQPGRRSQKRHNVFDQQCASRLAQHLVLDKANQIIVDNHIALHQTQDIHMETPRYARPSMFMVSYKKTTNVRDKKEKEKIMASVYGTNSLNLESLNDCVYPNLVEFIAIYFTMHHTEGVVKCLTEALGEDQVIYRCHPNYQKGGFWHDWAWVKFEDDKNSGYVPAKLLAFLPDGVPGSTECHAVCHPCQWKSKKKSNLLECWILQPCNKHFNNGIPYEMVPLTSLGGHCLAIPDLAEPGHIYTVLPRDEWGNLFWETNRLF